MYTLHPYNPNISTYLALQHRQYHKKWDNCNVLQILSSRDTKKLVLHMFWKPWPVPAHSGKRDENRNMLRNIWKKQ